MTEMELTIILRAVIAALLGFLIGWERKALGAPIRTRTTALAATTTAILVGMAKEFYPEEIARVVAGVVTGIGFLGASTILHSSTGEVKGHTTAASLWAMGAIGTVVGSGHELLGILLGFVLYTTIAISEWPLLTKFRQYWPKRLKKVVDWQPYQTPSESQTTDNPPAVK